MQLQDMQLQLRRLHEENVFGCQALSEVQSGVIIEASFIRTWRTWLQKPSDIERPASAETNDFFCAHGDLLLDFSNPSDFDDNLAVVTEQEYEILSQL
jgi:ubiquitin carboxyl-terminal hydrolase 48